MNSIVQTIIDYMNQQEPGSVVPRKVLMDKLGLSRGQMDRASKVLESLSGLSFTVESLWTGKTTEVVFEKRYSETVQPEGETVQSTVQPEEDTVQSTVQPTVQSKPEPLFRAPKAALDLQAFEAALAYRSTAMSVWGVPRADVEEFVAVCSYPPGSQYLSPMQRYAWAIDEFIGNKALAAAAGR